MIFPINIFDIEKRAGKTDGQTKRGALSILAIFINIVIYYFLAPIFVVNLGLSSFVLVMLQLVLNIIVGTALFRHFILKEEEQQKEYEASKSESLSNYYYIRKDEGVSIPLDKRNEVSIFEYTNNTFMFALKFRYGSNNNRKAISTRNCYREIFNILSNNGLEFRIFNMQDDFEDTEEYQNFVRRVSSIENPKLSRAMLEIADGILAESEEQSSVQCTVLLVRTTSPAQLIKIEVVIKAICKLVLGEVTAFRSMDFLQGDSFREFLRNYYGLEALDLAMVKAIEPDKNLIRYYKRFISLYQVRTVEGNIYTDDNILASYTDSMARRFDTSSHLTFEDFDSEMEDDEEE